MSRLLHPSHIRECERNNDEVPPFASSPTTSEQQLKKKGVLDTSFPDNFFETINVLTLSHTASYIIVDGNLDDDFIAKMID